MVEPEAGTPEDEYADADVSALLTPGDDTAELADDAVEPADDAAEPAASDDRSAWQRFRAWRRSRPFVGGLLTALGGIEMFFSGQLDIGRIHVQLGIEGLQATIIPVLLLLLGVLAVAMPAHRVFYGVIALAIAVYSLVGVNLGGFFIGMLLSTVGGILTVAWMPPEQRGERRRRGRRREGVSADDGPAEETA
ncbi:DUF6114 domain-containing protein [Leifsonia shinshuensis]|uniref:DUF6114 domain-containing protein n=1 Tax=Leifsonia shinshuensis TaxID=150026 RepID=UPI001C72839D|nr:DUF6114 domain-containing protein [Leifsonia shinshuensis]